MKMKMLEDHRVLLDFAIMAMGLIYYLFFCTQFAQLSAFKTKSNNSKSIKIKKRTEYKVFKD